MRKIRYAKPTRTNNEEEFDIVDIDINKQIEKIYKINMVNDMEIQRSLIDFNIIRLVSQFESGMKLACVMAFEDIKESNIYDFENIQIPVNELRKLDDADISSGQIFASSFNFQNPYQTQTFFSNIFQKDLFESFRKFLEYNQKRLMSLEEEQEILKSKEEYEFSEKALQKILLNQKSINSSIDEFIEIFNIRNKISHDPSFSSDIKPDHLCSMFLIQYLLLFFITFAIQIKSHDPNDEVDSEFMKEVKESYMDKILKLDI